MASGYIIGALGITIAYLAYDTYGKGNVEYVKSSVDQRDYLVQSRPDKEDAANLLAIIRQRAEMFIEYLAKSFPNDERTDRLIKKFDPERIREGIDNPTYTSYSVNKGEQVVFCLRSRDGNKKLEDENTMMFVALHELAHICTASTGHTSEYWDNFKWLLEEAVNIGIYKDTDYSKKPVEYCGVQITDTPLHKDDKK